MKQPSGNSILSTERFNTNRGVLWLGLKCDVRCKFCYDELLSNKAKTWVSLDEVKTALAKFSGYYSNKYVDFMGGEPTLHPDITEIVAYAASINLKPTIITHGMHLAEPENVDRFVDAGIHDFLLSIHGVGDSVSEIHGFGKNNYERQITAIENLVEKRIPFRFNCTVIKDNLNQLVDIAELAGSTGARVVNFLTFNPYFEWAESPEIEFQARHSEAAPHLMEAIDICSKYGVEANVRYMPICLMPGYESHVYTGFQLPYDSHEWDYNSWHDYGHPGSPGKDWYLDASVKQKNRHQYKHCDACNSCAMKDICDGFHGQYLARWGVDEANSYSGERVSDPCHFIANQEKYQYHDDRDAALSEVDKSLDQPLLSTQFMDSAKKRAGIKITRID